LLPQPVAAKVAAIRSPTSSRRRILCIP
jgi:hypothetical protein